MIWLVLILTMIFQVVPHWWSEGGLQFCVIFGSVANVVLGLLSRTRQRSASGGWPAKGQMALVFIVWFLYQVADAATGNAISNLTLCDSDATEEEKKVVALWAPFLLVHLGGPDNLTAYALEDNKLSGRKWVEVLGNIFWVVYAIYKYIYRGGGGGGDRGLLLAASTIMFVAGFIRYVERAYALWKANLDTMKEDASTSSKKSSSCSRCSAEEARMVELKSRIERKQGRREISDQDALLLAQDLFPIWRHALVDSSVMPASRSSSQLASETVLSLQWRSMCKVAEMELSLVYEVLYTKAIVAQSRRGLYYLIRFLSPLFTAAAALLFSLHQQGHGGIRGSYLGITYALLVINFLLDMAWLLRALGSTWAYAYLQQAHQVICPWRWRRLHRFVVRIDPMWWLLCRDPVSNRTWSGTIGQYNLLEECTTARSSQCPEWLVSLIPGDGPKELPYLFRLHPDVKELLFERVKEILQQAVRNNGEDPEHYSMEDIRTKWGEKAFDLRDRRRLFRGLQVSDPEAPKFGKEFEEDVLSWHIATCIILPYARQKQVLSTASEGRAKAIAVMSEYMMFLVAVRRGMLPGLVLHSLFEVTKQTLEDLWDDGKRMSVLSPSQMAKVANASNGGKLAMILRRVRTKQEDIQEEWRVPEIEPNEGSRLLWDAVELFFSLTLAGETRPYDRARRSPVPVRRLLEFIFNVWVDKLVYAAVRCSRESHAKQLSAGGDLTTVLWMLIQHAGPFRMGEEKPIYIEPHAPPQVIQVVPPPPPPPPQSAPPPAPAPYYPSWPPVHSAPVCPPCYPSWPPAVCPSYYPPQDDEPAEDEDYITPTTAPTSPPPDEASEDEDQEPDDEDETKEYNTPVNYVTLH